MKKKMIWLLCCMMLAALLAACGGEKADSSEAANPLTSTNNFESLATAGLFHIQRGSMGSLAKAPHIAKHSLKGVGTRPTGIIPSVMMKPLST